MTGEYHSGYFTRERGRGRGRGNPGGRSGTRGGWTKGGGPGGWTKGRGRGAGATAYAVDGAWPSDGSRQAAGSRGAGTGAGNPADIEEELATIMNMLANPKTAPPSDKLRGQS